MNPNKGKGKQGFASMSPDKQKQIASLGGKAAWAKGTAHHWNSDDARAAGVLGGAAGGRGRPKKTADEEL